MPGWLDSLRSPRWDEVTIWALDVELTGLDPRQAHLLSLGTVPIRGGVIVWGERWYTLVRPPSADAAATDAVPVHELLPDELQTAPEVAGVVAELARRLTGAALLVHWKTLDVRVLKRVFRLSGVPWPHPWVIDTADLLGRVDHRRRIVEPEPVPTPTQLSAARRALGLPAHEEHHALYDALATAELFLALRNRLGLKRIRQLT
ncbi:MAG: 3'-5' exonuclease [Thermoanaerobaculia bacterium]